MESLKSFLVREKHTQTESSWHKKEVGVAPRAGVWSTLIPAHGLRLSTTMTDVILQPESLHCIP